MFQNTDVGTAGELAVVLWLQAKGYNINNWDTKAPGSTDIEVAGSNLKLLVRVKSASFPKIPSSLSIAEELNITLRSFITKAQAWEARVLLNTELQPIGIGWRKLN